MNTYLEEKVRGALKRLGIVDVGVVIEFPGELSHGDFATNAALVAAQIAGISPKELAVKIVEELGTLDHVSSIDIAGPGFINFTLSRDYFVQTVLSIDESWGRNKKPKVPARKVAVEYTSPNLFKPLHIGNLMANIVGETISRLIEWNGDEVRRVNYPSDIGLTVAKGVWGVLTNKYDPSNITEWGLAYRDGSTAYEDNAEAKKEIDAINKKLYEGDPELTAIREKGIATSLARIRELCRILGTKFDLEFFESEVGETGRAVVRENIGNIFEESDKAIIFPGEKYGLHTRVFVNSLGLPTYEAKDLALSKLKYDTFPFDQSIVVTGGEQKEYFKVIIKAIELVYPVLQGKLSHIGIGFLTLTTGKMSSRKGNVLTGESVLEGVRNETLAIMNARDFSGDKEKTADQIAVAAIKYSVLKQKTGKNIIFNQKASLSFEGDSGPYLQYSYTRAMSVLLKSEIVSEPIPTGDIPVIERVLPRFPQVVERATREFEPHYITTYLTEIASAFNSWYAQEKILGSEHEAYKLKLTEAFATTMKNGLWLLGIETPKQM